jgi:hypothetical protein
MTFEEAEMIVSQLGWKPSVRHTEREFHLFAGNACIITNPELTLKWRSQAEARFHTESGRFGLRKSWRRFRRNFCIALRVHSLWLELRCLQLIIYSMRYGQSIARIAIVALTGCDRIIQNAAVIS